MVPDGSEGATDQSRTGQGVAPQRDAMTASPIVRQQFRAAGSDARLKSSRGAGRSRRGCYTCRKRKVKCDEERPICGHCHRLQLACSFEPAGCQDPPLTQKRSRQTEEYPVSSKQPRNAINNPRAQSVGFGPDTLRAYDSTLTRNLESGLNFDAHMGDQSQSRSLNPDTWELGLLGEDTLWANLPILPNLMSVEDSPTYEYVTSNVLQFLPNPISSNPGRELASTGDKGNWLATPISTFQSLDDISFIPTDEITLLRHFVDFAVPPILVGVEPRWNSSRDALLRLSKSSLSLRHAICAFSALSIEDSPSVNASSAAQTSSFYYNLAMEKLKKMLDLGSAGSTDSESHESILGSIFFISYVELIVSNAPKSSVHLLDRAHSLLSSNAPSSSSLCSQLQIWLKLLDSKVVSAGGAGIHLHTNPDTQDLEIVREAMIQTLEMESLQSTPAELMETEEIIFNSLNRQAYAFYLKVLNFSGRIAHLDKWHRSRGSVQDELEVMLAADKIVRDLNALWARRPAIIDLADQSEQLRQYMAAGLATRVEHHLRTYTANFHACFIHIQRVAYTQLQTIPQVGSAVANIARLSRLTVEEGHAVPVSMLWPLMMAACEAKEEETQNWIIECIEGMSSRVGNATRTAKLVKEIVKRQKNGHRADARSVMHDAFGAVFAII